MTRPGPVIAADAASFGAPLLRHQDQPPPVDAAVRVPAKRLALAPERVAVISNPRSHRNKRAGISTVPADLALHVETPASPAELSGTLGRFAAANIDLLVVDGGDGTVRDVISAAAAHFGETLPALAVVPSGKTNALAIDLGLPAQWTVRNAIEAARAGQFASRAPLVIAHQGNSATPVRGFLFGAGAFVLATRLAQSTHRAGAFKGIAVGLSLILAISKTMFGRKSNLWRAGEQMVLQADDAAAVERAFYMIFASTLVRLPLGLKPFGHPRAGLKLLAIDAPPKSMAIDVPALLSGSEREGLARHGYHRGDPSAFNLHLSGEFILDGEHYPGGDLEIRTGVPIAFAVP